MNRFEFSVNKTQSAIDMLSCLQGIISNGSKSDVSICANFIQTYLRMSPSMDKFDWERLERDYKFFIKKLTEYKFTPSQWNPPIDSPFSFETTMKVCNGLIVNGYSTWIPFLCNVPFIKAEMVKILTKSRNPFLDWLIEEYNNLDESLISYDPNVYDKRGDAWTPIKPN
jgi:hypothetical protein